MSGESKGETERDGLTIGECKSGLVGRTGPVFNWAKQATREGMACSAALGPRGMETHGPVDGDRD